MKAIIGGSGLCEWPDAETLEHREVSTEWGEATLLRLALNGSLFWFLPRHGAGHSLAPHAINYRANIAALREVGANGVVAVNAVGGIAADLDTGALCIPDQLIDYTWGREHSYYGAGVSPEHVDFTDPYDLAIRKELLAAAEKADESLRAGGCYAATQGPRLESAAEIRRLARDGCDLVGMTGMPEAGLARELNLAYASLCLVVNPAAGLSDESLSMEAINAALQRSMVRVKTLLAHWLAAG